MGIRDFFTKTVVVKERIHDSDSRDTSPGRRTYNNGQTKYGNIRYSDAGNTDYSGHRENARGIYQDSLIARGIVGRLVDNVINTGMTRECSPIWSEIPEWKNKTDEQKYQWTEHVENLFKLYANSKESDVKGRLTFNQLQRLLYSLRVIEGEYFIILRYLNGSGRTSPVAVQILNNDQIQQPYDGPTTKAIKERGNTCKHGIEYDATGKMVAIFVRDGDLYSGPLKRIVAEGPKSKRRFIIHDANFESPAQFRGFPEIASFVYELDRLTEYDINELEAVVAGALWFAAIETEKGASKKGPTILPAGAEINSNNEVEGGIAEVSVGSKSLLMQNLEPGQTFKGFQPNRPNPNFQAFEEVFENRIAGSLGMSLSVYRQKFQSSYSAARAEILFFWNNVLRRRDDFTAGFLNPFFEAWFTEHVNEANIKAPGYNLPIAHQAWLYGSWNGISRPVVDPLKEVNAVAKRQELGHTTREREAKAYNGSDYRENAVRLKTENAMIADANKPLDPQQYAEPVEIENNNDGGSDEEQN